MPSEEHGFTHVDADARPAAWIECLDRLHGEPFYRDYKARVRALLAPRAAGLYLEVGAGVGTDALALGAPVVAIDRSATMCREAKARGLARSIRADAEALPLPSDRFDGAWSDRTFQHLARPERALGELIRVLKPGGTLVVADPDDGTQALAFPDPRLAETVLDFRARHALRNGTLAHAMGDRSRAAGLTGVSVEERRLVVRDPASVDHVLGLRSWARAAAVRGLLDEDAVRRFEASYDALVVAGGLDWSVSFFLTSGRKPG